MAEEPTEGAQYITVGEAAQLLGVHRNTVRNRIKDGRIKAHKVIEGEREFYRIDANSLDVGRTSADVHNKVAQRTADGGNVVQMLVHRIDTAIEEVGELRERLGEERGRHIRVEEENERLRQELEALRASRQSSESQSATPTDTAVGSEEGTEGPQQEPGEGGTNGPPAYGEGATPQRTPLFATLVPLPREYVRHHTEDGNEEVLNIGFDDGSVIRGRNRSYAIGIVLTVAVSWLTARYTSVLGEPPLQVLALWSGVTVAFGIYLGLKDGNVLGWDRFNFIGALAGLLSFLVVAVPLAESPGISVLTSVLPLFVSYFLGTWLMFFSGVLMGKVVQYKAEQERWPAQNGPGFASGSGRVTGQWGPRATALFGLIGALGAALLQSMGQVIATLLGGGQ